MHAAESDKERNYFILHARVPQTQQPQQQVIFFGTFLSINLLFWTSCVEYFEFTVSSDPMLLCQHAPLSIVQYGCVISRLYNTHLLLYVVDKCIFEYPRGQWIDKDFNFL